MHGHSSDVVACLPNHHSVTSSIKFDDDTHILYDEDVLCNADARTVLLGVVESTRSFATGISDFIGIGVLGGVVAASTGSKSGSASDVDGRWMMLQKKLQLDKAGFEEQALLLCWSHRPAPHDECKLNSTERLDIDDVVGPVLPGGRAEISLYPGAPRAGFAILAKICGALANMMYSADTVAKVGRLALNNMMTVVHYKSLELENVASHGDDVWIKMRIRELLRNMLDPNASRTRSVHVNSNEPVLLINNFGNLRHEQLRDAAKESLEQLQQEWNIWPVRVYAGSFLSYESDGEHNEHGFSITLLNVVNTDIGGPSMVDLLDASCDAPVWSFALNSFFKEVWRDRSLISRVETEASTLGGASSDVFPQRDQESPRSDLSSAESIGSSLVHDGVEFGIEERMRESHHQLEKIDQQTPNADNEVVETAASGARSPRRPDTPIDDEPAWDDVRARFDPQGDHRIIDHPTWEHVTRRESLLDLVRSQAAGTEDAGEQEASQELGAESVASRQQTGNTSDDDFVVV